MALSDAYYFVNDVKARPRTISATQRKNRFLTAAIFLSWVGLEGAVVDELRRVRQNGHKGKFPRGLRDKLEFLFTLKDKTFDIAEYDKYRQVRNTLAHPDRYGGFPPDWKLANEIFEYCVASVKAFYPYNIHF